MLRTLHLVRSGLQAAVRCSCDVVCDGCMLQIVTVPLFRMLPFNLFSSREAGKARRHWMLLRKS